MRAPDSTIPVLLLIDVEPDEFFPPRDPKLRWRGFERGVIWTAEARRLISEVTGRPTRYCWGFRLDAQIEDIYGEAAWPLRRYRECLDEFGLHGDALGLHTHLYRWRDHEADWLIDQGNPYWVEHNVRLAHATFTTVLGHPPAFSRFGDRWISAAAMRLLDELGVPFDLTLEPGRGAVPTYHPEHAHTGFIPDMSSVPRRPYRPDRAHFDREDATGETRLVAIPSTTGRVRPPRSAWRAPSPRNVWAWLRYRLAPWYDVAGLYQEPQRLGSLLDEALEAGAPYLVLPMRTDSFSKGIDDGHLERVLGTLLEHPLASRFDFTTPAELVRAVAPQLVPRAVAADELAQEPQLRDSATAPRNQRRL